MDFTVAQSQLHSIQRAIMIVEQVRHIYRQCVAVDESLALYQAGTDQLFNDTVDDSYTSAEKQELNQMLTQIDALVSDWQANHGDLLEL